jgi:hypothetical protein
VGLYALHTIAVRGPRPVMWEVLPHVGTRRKQQASPKHCHPNNNNNNNNNNKPEIWIYPIVAFKWHDLA